VSRAELPEDLVALVEAIAGSERLRNWIVTYRGISESQRAIEFALLIERMRNAGEDADLIRTASWIEVPEIYRALCLILEEQPH
jgi:hypothetical protein